MALHVCNFFQEVLCVDLLGRVTLHDLLLETACTQANRQITSRFLLSACCSKLVHYFHLASDCNNHCRYLSCTAHRFLPPSESIERLCFSALPVSHECGFMPTSRPAHRTGNESQLPCSRPCPHQCCCAGTTHTPAHLPNLIAPQPSPFFCEPPTLLAEPWSP